MSKICVKKKRRFMCWEYAKNVADWDERKNMPYPIP